jgi:hypothetical protein
VLAQASANAVMPSKGFIVGVRDIKAAAKLAVLKVNNKGLDKVKLAGSVVIDTTLSAT